MVTGVSYCFVCKHEKSEFWVFHEDKGTGICKKCFKMFKITHQLNITEKDNR